MQRMPLQPPGDKTLHCRRKPGVHGSGAFAIGERRENAGSGTGHAGPKALLLQPRQVVRDLRVSPDGDRLKVIASLTRQKGRDFEWLDRKSTRLNSSHT